MAAKDEQASVVIAVECKSCASGPAVPHSPEHCLQPKLIESVHDMDQKNDGRVIIIKFRQGWLCSLHHGVVPSYHILAWRFISVGGNQQCWFLLLVVSHNYHGKPHL